MDSSLQAMEGAGNLQYRRTNRKEQLKQVHLSLPEAFSESQQRLPDVTYFTWILYV